MLPALKLTALVIHHLQAERGVTCGTLANGPQEHDTIFTCGMRESRTATDAVLEYVASRADLSAQQAALEVLRAAASEQVPESEMVDAFMDSFLGYDELIEDVQAELLGEDVSNMSTATTILAAFAQLKDALGVVRAFVAAALVVPEGALDTLSGRMRGKLVVCLHSLRSCTATIHASAPRKLLSLVSAGFELPNEITLVQRALETDLSVSAVLATHEWSVESWWAIASTHIDSMRALRAAPRAHACMRCRHHRHTRVCTHFTFAHSVAELCARVQSCTHCSRPCCRSWSARRSAVCAWLWLRARHLRVPEASPIACLPFALGAPAYTTATAVSIAAATSRGKPLSVPSRAAIGIPCGGSLLRFRPAERMNPPPVTWAKINGRRTLWASSLQSWRRRLRSTTPLATRRKMKCSLTPIGRRR